MKTPIIKLLTQKELDTLFDTTESINFRIDIICEIMVRNLINLEDIKELSNWLITTMYEAEKEFSNGEFNRKNS